MSTTPTVTPTGTCLRMAMIAPKITSGWRSADGVDRFAATPATSKPDANTGQSPIELLHQLLTTEPWQIPTQCDQLTAELS